jgi:hypothetical protein
VTRFPKASAISSPPQLLRLLPAGAVAGWALHPLESAALSRRTPITDILVTKIFGSTECTARSKDLLDSIASGRVGLAGPVRMRMANCTPLARHEPIVFF